MLTDILDRESAFSCSMAAPDDRVGATIQWVADTAAVAARPEGCEALKGKVEAKI